MSTDKEHMHSKTDFSSFIWRNRPSEFRMGKDFLEIITRPGTDFWQRTYYGFSSVNAPAFLARLTGDFTFSVKTDFSPAYLYDQCGLFMCSDDDNWAKASLEYENPEISRLGSVVTSLGYSDWASTDVPSGKYTVYYRLSRLQNDFYIENSADGITYHQLRMFHLHSHAPQVMAGVYACSPKESSFKACFSEFRLGPSIWTKPPDEQ